jgi:hypothetical protein
MSLPQRNAPSLHCNETASVLNAIECAWWTHHGRFGEQSNLYVHLAAMLAENGFVIDMTDGLQMLEHCRKADLPIIDILHTLETRVRNAGYRGGSLTLADYVIGAQSVYVFYDSGRFPRFADVRKRAAAHMRQMQGVKPA